VTWYLVSILDLIQKGVNTLMVARKTLLRIVYSIIFVTQHRDITQYNAFSFSPCKITCLPCSLYNMMMSPGVSGQTGKRRARPLHKKKKRQSFPTFWKATPFQAARTWRDGDDDSLIFVFEFWNGLSESPLLPCAAGRGKYTN
jgi:hypothetical protein